MTVLISPSLYPHFENELRKSACLSSFFNGISRLRDVSQLLPRSSSSWISRFGDKKSRIQVAVLVQYNESDKKVSYLKSTLDIVC